MGWDMMSGGGGGGEEGGTGTASCCDDRLPLLQNHASLKMGCYGRLLVGEVPLDCLCTPYRNVSLYCSGMKSC